MTKRLARIPTMGSTQEPAPCLVELVCRTDSLAALRAAADQGANSVRLVYRGVEAEDACQAKFQQAGLKKAVQYAQERACSVCLEVDAAEPLGASARAMLLRAFECGITEICLGDQTLALYLRLHHPDIDIRFLAGEAVLSRRAIALLHARLGIRRVVLPRVFSLAQLSTLHGVPHVELDVHVCGGGCAIIAGSKQLHGQKLAPGIDTASNACSDGVQASNDSSFIGSGYDSGVPLSLVRDLQQAGARGMVVETPGRSPARVAHLVRTWRDAIDLEAQRRTTKHRTLTACPG